MGTALLLQVDLLDGSERRSGIEKVQAVGVLFSSAGHKEFLALVCELVGVRQCDGSLLRLYFLCVLAGDVRDIGQGQELSVEPSLVRNHVLELLQKRNFIVRERVKLETAILAVYQRQLQLGTDCDVHHKRVGLLLDLGLC